MKWSLQSGNSGRFLRGTKKVGKRLETAADNRRRRKKQKKSLKNFWWIKKAS